MKWLLRLGMFAATLVALPASAGVVYKCIGADGVAAYGGKRVADASCTVVSRYTPPVGGRARGAGAKTSKRQAALADKASSVVAVPTKPQASVPPSAAIAVMGAPRRVVNGQVYSFIKNGVRNYSSARPRGVDAADLRTIKYSYIQTCYACGHPQLNFATLRLNTTAYSREITQLSREFGIEEAIVRAVIHAESAFNPLALSHVGAMGLMQLMPATARRFGVTDAYDAAQNIRGGVQYLAFLLKRYQGNLALAAAGYNAGEGAVDRNGGVPPYAQTQRYVRRVAVLAERYRANVGDIGSR